MTNRGIPMRFELVLSGRKYAVDAEGRRNIFVVNVGGRKLRLGIRRIGPEHIRVAINRATRKVELVEETASRLLIAIDGKRFTLEWPPALRETVESASARSNIEKDLLLSPLPGTVTSVEISRKQVVSEGTPLVMIEAMKMESTVRSDRGGRVSEILVRKGESVRKGQPIVRFSGEGE